MITKYRNRGLIQFVAALHVAAIAIIVFVLVDGKNSDGWIAFMVLAYLATIVLLMAASFSLAKAKGYADDMVGGMFLFLFLLGCCIPFAPFLFPFVVLLGLKDKTQRRSRSRD